MKQKILIIITLCILSINANAQVMEWVIKPNYKQIEYIGGDLYKVKGAAGKWGVYNASTGEQTIVAEYDSITSLVEQRALILDKSGTFLYGIINESGNPISSIVPASQKPDLIIMHEYPYYSDGLLVVGQPVGKYYNFGYVDKQGNQKIALKYLYACPFNNGQAMVYTTKKSYQIIDKQGNFPYVGNDKINFLSNPINGEFILVTDNNRISRARLINSKFERINDLEKGQVVYVADATMSKSIASKGPHGKTYMFDDAFHYIDGGNKPSYNVSIKENSDKLQKTKNGWLYAIKYNTTPILPEQFKDVHIYKDEYAVVSLSDGTKGVLRYNPSGKIEISGPSSSIEFAHNIEQKVPISAVCRDFMNTSQNLELKHDGVTYVPKGTGKIELPFYESHNKVGETTTKQLEFEIVVDKLKYANQTVDVKSSHCAGFKLGSINIPSYSDDAGNATVTIVVQAINGTPSASAKATVNGVTRSFNGNQSVSIPINVSVPVGGTKKVSYKVTVTEDDCPVWSSQTRSGVIQHISRK